MSKAPKFMIAKNKMADPYSVYIYHSQKPRMLLKIEDGGVRVIDDIDSYKEFYKGEPEKIKGLFNRLSDWYRAYIINGKKVE